MMFDSTSKINKNLWRSIKTEKQNKHQNILENLSSPVFSTNQEGPFNLEQFQFNYQEKRKQNNQHDEDLLSDEAESNEIDSESEENRESYEAEYSKGHEENVSETSNSVYDEIVKSNNETNSRARRIEQGEESVVEEIVDIKCTNGFSLPEFPEQPMMLSLCNQPKDVLKQLKLLKAKEEIRKLLENQEELLYYVKQSSLTYFQYFEHLFGTTITEIIEYHANKHSAQSDEKNNRVKEPRSSADSNEDFFKNSINFNRQSETDTPKFPPSMGIRKIGSKISTTSDLDERSEEILRLEEEVFKVKTESKEKDERIESLEEEKDIMIEQIFDYNQKMAQIELEINSRVERIVKEKLKEGSKEYQSLEKLREEYLLQIEDLEEKVNNLSELSRSKELVERQIEEREESLKFLSQSLNFKEIQLNNMQLTLSELQISYDLKIEKLKKRENELEEMYDELEKREMELTLKEQKFTQNTPIKTLNNNETQFQSLKLKTLFYPKFAPITSRETTRKNSNERQPNNERHGTSYERYGAPNIIERYPTNYNEKFSSNIFTPYKPSDAPLFNQEAEHTSRHHSRSGSNEKDSLNKNKRGQNRTGMVVKSQINPHKNHTFNYSNSMMRNHDRNRIEDLGNKLETLREQIKKEIREVI